MKRPLLPFRLALRRRARIDVDEEFAFHIEMRTAELIRLGWESDRARLEAQRQFGDVEEARKFCGDTDERRESRNMKHEWMQEIQQDVSFAVRALRRAPAFAIVAVLTLALGIGANTAIFSVVRGILLRPLPFAQPEQLVVAAAQFDGERSVWSPANLHDVREQNRSFTAISALESRPVVLTGAGSPERLRGYRVSADFFDMLGVRAVRGRLVFNADEARFNGPKSAVIAESVWRSRFGSDSTLVGRNIMLDNESYQLIGVAPDVSAYPAQTVVWFPFTMNPADLPTARGVVYLNSVARLKPGVTVEAARTDIKTLAERLARDYPDNNRGFGANVVPLTEWIYGEIETPLMILLGGVGFVLLIACANVANLMLVRGVARESEMAVRTALGAGRGRLVRQLATESVVLSLFGGALGLGLAYAGTDVLLRMAPTTLPRLDSVRIDSFVMLFTMVTALVTGLVFGLLPSRHAARSDIARTLREGGKGAASRSAAPHARRLLVVTELALSVMLLAGAGLLIKSFNRLISVDPGFRAENAVSFNISLPRAKYPTETQQRAFMNGMLDRIEAVPGVQKVGAAVGMPLTPFSFTSPFAVSGRVYATTSDQPSTEVRVTTPDYVSAMGITLVKGRTFNKADRAGGQRVLLITESAAQKFFPGEDPIGKHVTMQWRRDSVNLSGDIVGIVRDFRQFSLSAAPLPQFYAVFDQWPVASFNVIIRSARDLTKVANEAGIAIHEIDPDLAVSRVRTLETVFAESVAQPKFYMTLLTVFAGLALVLTSIGVYGVVAYLVGQRTREIGIRVALGASRASVVSLIAREGLAMTSVGVVVGLVGAATLSRLMSALLFETAPMDITTYAAVVVVLGAVATAACVVPAIKAARVDPVLAIRGE